MRDNTENQEFSGVLDEELLNLDEFPEDFPEIADMQGDDALPEEAVYEPLTEEVPPTAEQAPFQAEPPEELDQPFDQAPENAPVWDAPEEAADEAGEEETAPADLDEEEPSEKNEDTAPTRVVGWVFKKTSGKAPEVQVVEAPVNPPEPLPTEAEAEEEVPEAEPEAETDETPAESVAEEAVPEEEPVDEDLAPWQDLPESSRTPSPVYEEPIPEEPEDAEFRELPKATWRAVFQRMFRKKKQDTKAAPDEAEQEQGAAPQLTLLEPVDPEDEEWGEEVAPRENPIMALLRTPPMPDISPKQLAVLYGNRLESLKRNLILAFVLCIPLVYLNLTESLNLPVPQFLWDDSLLVGTMLELLGVILLLLGQPFVSGLADLFRRRAGLHTVASLAVLITLLDGAVFILIGREGPLPIVCGAAIGLLFSGIGQYQERKGSRLSCRTAAMADNPSRLSLLREEGQVTDMLLKYPGDHSGFGTQVQERNAVQKATGPLSLVVMLGSLLAAIFSAVGEGEPELLFWCMSVTCVLASPLAATLAYGIPWAQVSERLKRCGAAIAGWEGVKELKETKQLTIVDDDLFPAGMINQNGVKFYDSYPSGFTVGYAATLIREMGGSLVIPFEKIMFSQGGKYWSDVLQNFERYESGGCSGVIGDNYVLVGTRDFMKEMEIDLPDEVSVSTAVYCAVNGKIAGQFAIVYRMPSYVVPAANALLRGKYTLVMAVRDFNLNTKSLRRQPNFPMDQILFPDMDTRDQLAEIPDDEGQPLGALLSREGLDGHCDAVLASKTLYRVVRQNSLWVFIESVMGFLLGLYLTGARAYTALQPLNVLIFLGIMLVPCLLNALRAARY